MQGVHRHKKSISYALAENRIWNGNFLNEIAGGARLGDVKTDRRSWQTPPAAVFVAYPPAILFKKYFKRDFQLYRPMYLFVLMDT